MTLKTVTAQVHDTGENIENRHTKTTCSHVSAMNTLVKCDEQDPASVGEMDGASSPVGQFFKNKSVFITGATGFLGKALLEKLLWQYVDIKHIYILVRSKRDQSVEQRFKEQIASSPIFDRLRGRLLLAGAECEPSDAGCHSDDAQQLLETLLMSKIRCIVGDASLPRLNINDTDWKTLTEDTSLSIIFHLAATVKFNEPLRHAVRMNVGGVKSVIKLARSLKNLECLCHVSTAYVNADILDPLHIIEERVYPVHEDPEKMLKLVECINDSDAKLLESQYLKHQPNTYTYTKALAEKLIANDATDLPVVIIRPSIVTPAWREPSRGWVDNFYGITGMALAYGTGLLRIAQVDRDKFVDLIPVDSCVSTIIAAAWYEATQHRQWGTCTQTKRGPQPIKQANHIAANINNRSDNVETVEQDAAASHHHDNRTGEQQEANEQTSIIDNNLAGQRDETHIGTNRNHVVGHKIYHCTSIKQNRVSWSQVLSNGADMNLASLQVGHLLRAPRLRFSKYTNYVKIIRFFCHTLVAFIVDLIYSLMGHKAKFMKTYKKLDELMGALSYFTCHQWRFRTNNIEHLYSCLSDTDKKQLYSMNLRDMHWQTSWYDAALAFRRYLLKRDMKKLPSDLRNLRRVRMIDVSLRSVSLLIGLSSILRIYPFSWLSLTNPLGIICFLIYIMLSIIVWH